jgi:hypothetical protein
VGPGNKLINSPMSGPSGYVTRRSIGMVGEILCLSSRSPYPWFITQNVAEEGIPRGVVGRSSWCLL